MILASSFFGAPKIPYENLTDITKDAPEIIVYAIPAMAFFTLLEIVFNWYHQHGNYRTRESIGSTLVGLGNVLINFLLKVVLLFAVVWVYNLVPWRMQLSWWTFLPCYIVFDLCSYWAHRISHQKRFFWTTHCVHHSAEHITLRFPSGLAGFKISRSSFFFR